MWKNSCLWNVVRVVEIVFGAVVSDGASEDSTLNTILDDHPQPTTLLGFGADAHGQNPTKAAGTFIIAQSTLLFSMLFLHSPVADSHCLHTHSESLSKCD